MKYGSADERKYTKKIELKEVIWRKWSIESEETFIKDLFEITNRAYKPVKNGKIKWKRLYNPSDLLALYFRSKRKISESSDDEERIAFLDDIARKIFGAVVVCVLDAWGPGDEKKRLQLLSASETDFVTKFYKSEHLDDIIEIDESKKQCFWKKYKEQMENLGKELLNDINNIQNIKENYWNITTKNDFCEVSQMYGFPCRYADKTSQGVILFKCENSNLEEKPWLNPIPYICRAFLHGIDTFSSGDKVDREVKDWKIPILRRNKNRCYNHYTGGKKEKSTDTQPVEVLEESINNCTAAKFSTEDRYILRVLADVRKNVHEVLDNYIIMQDYSLGVNDELPMKEFMVLFMYKNRDGYRWFHLPEQEENLKAQTSGETRTVKYQNAVKFTFIDSGLISYLAKIKRRGEFIINFKNEYFLIKMGYKIDEKEPPNRDINVSAEDIRDLESKYPGVSNNPYFYFNLYDDKNLQQNVWAVVCLPRKFLDPDFFPERCKLFMQIDRLMDRWHESLRTIFVVRDMVKKDTEAALRSAIGATASHLFNRAGGKLISQVGVFVNDRVRGEDDILAKKLIFYNEWVNMTLVSFHRLMRIETTQENYFDLISGQGEPAKIPLKGFLLQQLLPYLFFNEEFRDEILVSPNPFAKKICQRMFEIMMNEKEQEKKLANILEFVPDDISNLLNVLTLKVYFEVDDKWKLIYPEPRRSDLLIVSQMTFGETFYNALKNVKSNEGWLRVNLEETKDGQLYLIFSNNCDNLPSKVGDNWEKIETPNSQISGGWGLYGAAFMFKRLLGWEYERKVDKESKTFYLRLTMDATKVVKEEKPNGNTH